MKLFMRFSLSMCLVHGIHCRVVELAQFPAKILPSVGNVLCGIVQRRNLETYTFFYENSDVCKF